MVVLSYVNGDCCFLEIDDGVFCVFFFIFNGKSYEECIIESRVKLWCSIIVDYDRDYEWGFCRYLNSYWIFSIIFKCDEDEDIGRL